jgi:hypothetical protein
MLPLGSLVAAQAAAFDSGRWTLSGVRFGTFGLG